MASSLKVDEVGSSFFDIRGILERASSTKDCVTPSEQVFVFNDIIERKKEKEKVGKKKKQINHSKKWGKKKHFSFSFSFSFV